MQYEYEGNRVFFIQGKSDVKTSVVHSSDAKENYEVWNSRLRINIEVYQEPDITKIQMREARFTYNGVYYHLLGKMDQEEFDAILKKIQF